MKDPKIEKPMNNWMVTQLPRQQERPRAPKTGYFVSYLPKNPAEVFI
jgi:hypothetical protein